MPIDSPARALDSPSRALDSPSRALDSPSRAFDSPSRGIGGAHPLQLRGGGIVPLPETAREAAKVKDVFPDALLLTGSAAQEGVFKQDAAKYKYLHVATHGWFNDASPLLSCVIMAQPPRGDAEDGFLTAREIFGMKLSADLTVLSACKTAKGEEGRGEGMLGLTWSLFAAGCPTQVVSQWSVDDRATADLMSSFYGNLKKGMGKSDALRAASLTMMHSPDHRHPFYWAPFIVVGAWK